MLDHSGLAAYAEAHTTPKPLILHELTKVTAAKTEMPGMQTGHTEAAFLTTLTHIMQPRLVVEVGTFTGASALAITRALPPDGRILCCDVSEEWTAIAREFWDKAGVADRIELRIGPAAETLASLPPQPTVDLAFIDADKPGYIEYFEALIDRLSPHGLIVADNVLWDGAVLDPSISDPNTEAIRAFNDHVLVDDRVDVVLLPVGDGMSLITWASPM